MKNSFFKYSCIVFLLVSSVCYGQTYKQAVKYGNQFLKEGNYYNAIAYFEIAIKQDSSKNKLLFNYAEALRKNNQNKKAKYYYQKVYSSDSGKEFELSAFWLGYINKSLGNYKESIKYYNLSKKRARTGTYERLKSEQEIKSCEWALQNDSVYPVRINHPGKKINTTSSDFAAFPIGKNEIYFSRISPTENDSDYTKKNIDILLGFKEDGVWDTIGIDTTYINRFDNANSSINPNKKRFYLTICTDSNRCDIYAAEYNSGKFSQPKKLSVNSPISSSTQPMEARIDGKSILLFSSNRKGGEGKFDLWYSEIEDGKYATPKNLGKTINSIDNELTPYYDEKNTTLYFSSEWHYGFGGLDIFKAKGTIDNFEEPVNLLKPINTKSNDLYYIQYKDTSFGYLASNREGSFTNEEESCCNDIYQFETFVPDTPKIDTPPTNTVVIKKVEQPKNTVQKILVNLYFHNDEPNPRTWKTETELNYDQVYKSYQKMKPEYYKMARTQKEVTELYTQYVEKGRRDLDKFTAILYNILKTGKPVFIKVRGFASPLTKTGYNLNLSKRRIDSFKNYLEVYQGGIFKQFLNNNQIKFIELPFGEFTSKNNVTDDPKDPAAVFSLGAGLERRIEISFEYRP